MANLFKQFVCGSAVIFALSVAEAQVSTRAPSANETEKQPTPTPPVMQAQSVHTTAPAAAEPNDSSMVLVQAAPGGAATPAPKTAATPATPGIEDASATDNGGVGVREFQGDDVGQVLRLLARQSKINMVVSDAAALSGTVTVRLEDVTALQAIAIIVKAKSLFMVTIDNVSYVKTAAEQGTEPTESDHFQFGYARAKEVAPLLKSQLVSKGDPQIDERTNTIFYAETRGNIDNIRKMLVEMDKPTKQVMIEARLVEVTANPRQSYGLNWAGVFGSSTNPQTFKFGGSSLGTPDTNKLVPAQTVLNPGTATQVTVPRFDANGIPIQGVTTGTLGTPPLAGFDLKNFLFDTAGAAIGGQFAILSAPQMSVTLRALNEDADAEFLANPRIVTADNREAEIKITRAQPVPQLNFNEQTATAVFGGFQDKEFGNTLKVTPSVNKDNFVTLNVKPKISNRIGDQTFVFAGATVASPVIDTRSLESNVLIKSGDTLAIGGLLQDEQTKARSKVPILGDIPLLGYFFQEKLNARTKRNLLVFVTPTIIDARYGTGLEDQISGLHHSGEEYADPNGWRNNAKGAVRLVPTSQRQLAADYPKPGIPPAPEESARKVRFMSTAKDRDF